MKKLPLIIYCFVYFLISLGDIVYSFINTGFSISMVISLIVSLILLVVCFGYFKSKAILDAGTWRRIFYILVTLYGLLLFMSLLSIGMPQSIEGVISVLMTIPVLYCLYTYSKGTQEFWGIKKK